MQSDLFSPDDNPKLSEEARERLSRQLVQLGDMMGDGLHHEPDGRWIPTEYRKVLKALHPDIFERQARARNDGIDESMRKLLAEKRCTCGGMLIQKRRGAKTCTCVVCGKQYKAVKGKR